MNTPVEPFTAQVMTKQDFSSKVNPTTMKKLSLLACVAFVTICLFSLVASDDGKVNKPIVCS
jgi:hypothetical protein